MITCEGLTIETDEGRYVLVVDDSVEGQITYDIHHLALEFFDEVLRKIGPYAHEAESARKAVAAGMSRADYLDSPQPVRSRPVSVEDAIEAGYALDDPKSPGYHDRMVD